jgi:hypothetical protein
MLVSKSIEILTFYSKWLALLRGHLSSEAEKTELIFIPDGCEFNCPVLWKGE